MSEEYKKILRHNEAYYPKGKSIYSNESTNTFSRELKSVSELYQKLSEELTEKLERAENVLQRHAVLYAFIETHYQPNIQVDEFYQFLFRHLFLIEKSFSEYAELDEGKLESECAHPPIINPAKLDNVSFFCRLPKALLSIADGYCELNEDEYKFLQHVARGEQRAAETMLKSDPQLLLCRGEMVEHNGRTFKSATAFQYAVWAKDMHMLTMLKKYAPEESLLRQAIKEQLQEFKTKGLTYTYDKWTWVEDEKDTTYGGYRKQVTSTIVKGDSKGFDFKPLIDALAVYSQKLKAWQDVGADNTPQEKACYHQWQKVVGDAQRLLPAHVAHEYCQGDRSFWEVGVNFAAKGESLVRSLSLWNTGVLGDGELQSYWYSENYNGGVLGETFAVDGSGRPSCYGLVYGRCEIYRAMLRSQRHLENIQSLSATRTHQLYALVSEILVTPAASQQLQ